MLKKNIQVVMLMMLAFFFQFTLISSSFASEKVPNDRLKLSLFVVPSKAMLKSDSMGIYAVEMLECQNKQVTQFKPVVEKNNNWLLGLLENTTDLFVSSAWANHRDHFDRPGAKIVTTRVFFNKPSKVNFGEVSMSQASYCQVRLTLTRLAGSNEPKGLPALETSIYLTRPAKLPVVALNYPVALVLNLPSPWQAKQGMATLTMTLDPASASDILADVSLGEGALIRKLAERWVQTSYVQLSAIR
jgi:hypothetical protein